MHMTFYWGNSVTLLFDSWVTNSWLSYLLSLFACFLFAMFYQYIEDRRLQFKAIVAAGDPSLPSADTPLIRGLGRAQTRLTWSRLSMAVLFGFNAAIGYLLMLLVMSYNFGVFLAVVLGFGVGYLLFRD